MAHALQIGGRAAELGQILQPDGDQYIFSCNLQDMAKLNTLVKSILDYAANNYPGQMVVDENGNLNNLAADLLTDPESKIAVEDYGINPGPSQLTPEGKEARLEIAKAYKANKYYLDKLTTLRNHYPVKLEYEVTNKLDILIGRIKQNNYALMDAHSEAIKNASTFQRPV
ncbi:MAG: hypothetical protein GY710_20765 [Desulfobacteraceae bacterium]|nr:hypothetical protein [Desulfobacteraceae bacterium]